MDAAHTMGPELPLARPGLLPDKFFLYQVDHFFLFFPFFPLSLLLVFVRPWKKKRKIKINK